MRISILRVSAAKKAALAITADLLVVPVPKDAKKPTGIAGAIDKSLKGAIATFMEAEHFSGKEGEHVLYRSSTAGVPDVLLIGIGYKRLSDAVARKLTALAVREARHRRAKSVAFLLPEQLAASPSDVAEAITEGALLGDYRYLAYKEKERKEHEERALETLVIVMPDGKKNAAAEKGITLGEICCRATIRTRDLVNGPASDITPSTLVEDARAIAATNPKRYSITVHDESAMRKMGMGGVLAIAKGSDEPPYLIHLAYRPAKKARKRVAIVGKGITFDSGGLSIKPSSGMEDMKIDMAGCAAMLGAMSALAELAPDVEVHGISAVCENMPSGKAVRPGDIVRTMKGKTIEILNTDAEGRVTLADTLHYAETLEPDAIIDLATLTGACMVALGNDVAGLMSNDRPLASKILAAAASEGELLWELPLVDEYRPQIKSKQADLKNITSGRYGGAITAGLFLQEFVDKTPWAHLDIAGPAWAETDSVPHQPFGATGFGVRTLLEFIQKL